MDDFLAKAKGCRVLVVGDAILDRYVSGRVKRLSPEAPVPVVNVDGAAAHDTLGGAANVAANLVAMGAAVTLYSAIGTDAAGNDLCHLLKTADVRLAFAPAASVTTVKTRILGNDRHICRLDHDGHYAAFDVNSIVDRLAEFDAVVLVDYGKGMLSDLDGVRQACTAIHGCGVFGAYAPKPHGLVSGVNTDLICANSAELSVAVASAVDASTSDWSTVTESEQAWLSVLTRLVRQNTVHRAAVMTLGAAGAAGLVADPAGDCRAVLTPAQVAVAADVTGAGDTYLSALVLALLVGTDLTTAMVSAGAAAAAAVSRIGTAVVTADEIRWWQRSISIASTRRT